MKKFKDEYEVHFFISMWRRMVHAMELVEEMQLQKSFRTSNKVFSNGFWILVISTLCNVVASILFVWIAHHLGKNAQNALLILSCFH